MPFGVNLSCWFSVTSGLFFFSDCQIILWQMLTSVINKLRSTSPPPAPKLKASNLWQTGGLLISIYISGYHFLLIAGTLVWVCCVIWVVWRGLLNPLSLVNKWHMEQCWGLQKIASLEICQSELQTRWGFQVVKQIWFGGVKSLSDVYRAEKGGLICIGLRTDGAGKPWAYKISL